MHVLIHVDKNIVACEMFTDIESDRIDTRVDLPMHSSG